MSFPRLPLRSYFRTALVLLADATAGAKICSVMALMHQADQSCGFQPYSVTRVW
jgi:hypothetical protein